METQKAFSFDKETIKKIGKSALLLFVGYGLVAVIEYLAGIEVSDPNIQTILTMISTWLVNTIKEYIKGAK
jgi:hypothetical protein